MAESKTSERRLRAIERQRQALELRKGGASFPEIAKGLGYSGPAGAYQAVMSALRRTLKEPAEEVRTLEVARLDAMLLALWAQVKRGNPAAVDKALKVEERRAKLLGLDAPTKIAPTDPSGEQEYASLTDDERLERIEELLARARARRDRQAAKADRADGSAGDEGLDRGVPVDTGQAPPADPPAPE